LGLFQQDDWTTLHQPFHQSNSHKGSPTPFPLSRISEFAYNDGVHPGGGNVDHDWSNAVFGIATDFDLGGNFTLTPAIYHQITMDKSINPDQDETWVGLSVTYKFLKTNSN